MKTKLLTPCLSGLLPLNVLAHPGHDHGAIFTATGWPGAVLTALLALAAAGGSIAALRLRRRLQARADD